MTQRNEGDSNNETLEFFEPPCKQVKREEAILLDNEQSPVTVLLDENFSSELLEIKFQSLSFLIKHLITPQFTHFFEKFGHLVIKDSTILNCVMKLTQMCFLPPDFKEQFKQFTMSSHIYELIFSNIYFLYAVARLKGSYNFLMENVHKLSKKQQNDTNLITILAETDEKIYIKFPLLENDIIVEYFTNDKYKKVGFNYTTEIITKIIEKGLLNRIIDTVCVEPILKNLSKDCIISILKETHLTGETLKIINRMYPEDEEIIKSLKIKHGYGYSHWRDIMMSNIKFLKEGMLLDPDCFCGLIQEWNDKQFIMECIEYKCKIFKYIPQRLLDRDVFLKLVEFDDGELIKYAPSLLRSDKEMVMKALKNNITAYHYITIKQDLEVRQFIRSSPKLYKLSFCCVEFSDIQLAITYFSHKDANLNAVPDIYRNHYAFMKKLVTYHAKSIEIASDYIRTCKNYLICFLQHAKSISLDIVIRFIPIHYEDDRDFVVECLKHFPSLIEHWKSLDWKNDKFYALIKISCGKTIENYRQLSTELQKDDDIIKILTRSSSILEVPKEFCSFSNRCETIIYHNCSKYFEKFVDMEMLNNPNLWKYMNRLFMNGMVKNFTQELKDSIKLETLSKYIKIYPEAFISLNKEFKIEVMKHKSSLFRLFEVELKADRDFALECSKYGSISQHFDNNLKMDAEFMKQVSHNYFSNIAHYNPSHDSKSLQELILEFWGEYLMKNLKKRELKCFNFLKDQTFLEIF